MRVLPNSVSSALAEVERRASAAETRAESAAATLLKLEESLELAQSEYMALKASFDESLKDLSNVPQLAADLWREKELVASELQEFALKTKSHPAYRAADEVARARRELAAERSIRKQFEFELAMYKYDFPWLVDYSSVETDPIDTEGAESSPPSAPDEGDPALQYLSSDEYKALSSAERNQLALDRYVASRRKSKWQIGRDYEMYVGFQYERAGWRVTYKGILERFEDLGRDVIASRGDTTEVVQCKNWSAKRVIRENHIFQLAGTVLAMQQDESVRISGRQVVGRFFTSTTLSPVARAFAERLGLHVTEDQPIGDFPRIKCNVARNTRERIYHLPFDHSYDRTVIEPKRGEFFAWTAAEAEGSGFRRSWRWRPDS
jgi:hypothetical protein